MKLFLVSQNEVCGYDTYDSFVIACENENKARETNPSSWYIWKNDSWYFTYRDGSDERSRCSSWCYPKDVKVQYLGESEDGISGVICASFNAGF